MKNFWNVILHTVEGDKVKAPKNNTKKSGNYLCTCIHIIKFQLPTTGG